MSAKGKNILVTVFLLRAIEPEAQVINWNNINLVGNEAKIIAIAGSKQQQNNLLIAKTFETKEGKINVFLPPISSAVTLSGTVYLEPAAKDSSRNLAALQSYTLNLGDLGIPVQRGSFQLKLPTEPGSGMISLQLKSSAGQLIKYEQITVTTSSVTSSLFIIPPYIVSGDATTITGNFDGNISNAAVKIEGEKIELLAESPSQLFFTSTANQTGKVTIECTENGTTQRSTSNLLKLDLSADKTNLRRGQQTQIHIQITGLEGLKELVPVQIINTSASVILLEGGNTQQITLAPVNDAPSGVFQTTRNIISQRNGNFSVTVSIIPFQTTDSR